MSLARRSLGDAAACLVAVRPGTSEKNRMLPWWRFYMLQRQCFHIAPTALLSFETQAWRIQI